MDLSVIIPARKEMFLEKTIRDVLAHARADTEVIAVLDGYWPDPPLMDHPKLRVTHSERVIGQRAATNLGARISTADYVMKLDAHCSIAEGFDVELIAADKALGRPDITQIPAMYNLHAFNWKCLGCGTETYQGPTPTLCAACGAKGTPGGPFERVIYWDLKAGGIPGRDRRTEFWRFDHELHFQYWTDYRKRPEAQGEIVDVMSSVGACFFMRRARFEALGGLDEAHGSWGQFGTEIACKSWLSGGRHVVNKNTWFAHLFRTQGGDFGFPYQNPQAAVNKAREHSRALWIEGTWSGATYPLSWMLDKFAPIPDWTEEQINGVRRRSRSRDLTDAGGSPVPARDEPAGSAGVDLRSDPPRHGGLAYYSDCRGDQAVLDAVRHQLIRAKGDRPLVAVTLKPIAFGRNIVLPLERGYLAMFTQQLVALEELDTDYVFFVEHDVLYHPSHFDFVPPRDDTFYYNQHTYRVDAQTGQALFYYCNQVSGLCANRQLLIDHYRKRVKHVEIHGYDRNLGFEPGTNRRAREAFGAVPVETWMSAEPNVDIKTSFSLTPGRWDQAQFRNKNSCQGWKLVDEIPGWGRTKDRVRDFLAGVTPALERTA